MVLINGPNFPSDHGAYSKVRQQTALVTLNAHRVLQQSRRCWTSSVELTLSMRPDRRACRMQAIATM